MKKTTLFIIVLISLATAGCSVPRSRVETQSTEQLPTNRLTLPLSDDTLLYYSADEISQLTNCSVQARQAELLAPEKRDGAKIYLSKSDYAMDFFKSCATTNSLTAERVDRAAYCMAGQFLAEYIWTAKQQGASKIDVLHRLADSPNKAVALVTRDIYSHEAENLGTAQTRLWDDCIHNFKQVKAPQN